MQGAGQKGDLLKQLGRELKHLLLCAGLVVPAQNGPCGRGTEPGYSSGSCLAPGTLDPHHQV